MLNDFRVAWRSLLKNPGFSLVVVLTLALGIGANSAIFTVAKGVLLDPLPYPEPDRLVVIMEANLEKGFPRFSVSPPNWIDFRDRTQSYSSMAALTQANLSLVEEGHEAQRVEAFFVTGDYFEVFGVKPQFGRGLGTEDDRPEAEKVVVLGFGFWQTRFAGGEVLDRNLVLDGESHRVVGVMPEGFQERTDLFVPLAMAYEETQRGAHYLRVRARLKPGVELDTARTELVAVAKTLEQEYPDSNEGWSTVIEPLHGLMVENFQSVVFLLFGAVFLVLLIACVNVANLFLVRLADQEREVALRSALGAGRGALVRQWMAETLSLSFLGGALGVLLGIQGTQTLVRLAADDIPRASEVGVDVGVLAFTALLSMLTGILLGLLPATQQDDTLLSTMLKEGGRGQAGGRRGRKMRALLVAAEVAVAVLLLIGAGLLLRSLAHLVEVNPGFETEGVLTARLSLPESRYPEDTDLAAFYRQLQDRLSALSGVEHAGTIMPMPLTDSNFLLSFYIKGTEIPDANEFPVAHIRVVNDQYFEAMGIGLQVGRTFKSEDLEDSLKVAVINRSAANKFWPDQDPLWQRFTFDDPEGEEDPEWLTVIGVVSDVRHESLSAETDPEIYWLNRQNPMDTATLVLKSKTGSAGALLGPLKQELAAIDSSLPLYEVQTLNGIVNNSLAQPRFNGLLVGLFAALALLLASLGVYGVIRYAVSQETREIGIRLALGAAGSRILMHVLSRATLVIGAGIAIGLLLGALLSRFLSGMIHGISPTDAFTFGSSALVLFIVGLVACWLPAQRAMSVDPAVVLRDE